MTDTLVETPSSPVALRETAAHLAAASIAPATRRVYSIMLTALDEHLEGRALDDAALADFLGLVFEQGKSPSWAGLLVSAVRFRSRLQEQASPAGPATERVLAGFRREGRDRGHGQVVGIGWGQADAAAALAAKTGNPRGRRDAAIISIGSDALLRVAEIAALVVDDIVREDDGSGRLTVRHSKTDQEGAGAVQFLGPTTVARVDAWLGAAGISGGPLFRPVRKDGRPGDRHLTTQSLRKIIATRAADAGIEGRISGHSLRVGSAQSLAAAGATLVEMQTEGRWRSPAMPGHYARGQMAGRGATARLRYGTSNGEQ